VNFARKLTEFTGDDPGGAGKVESGGRDLGAVGVVTLLAVAVALPPRPDPYTPPTAILNESTG
jgi:hypothetical protein